MRIDVQNLRKSFRSDVFAARREVLRGVTFSVPLDQTTGLIGLNGSGKTTTLKCLLGFLQPQAGQIVYAEGSFEKFQKKWGYLPERPYFYEFLTALEFLRFHWDLAAATGDFLFRASEVLEQVGLARTGDKKLREFSKGMLQRVGLAQALLMRPQLLILDEPMSGLDPDGRLMVKKILLDEKKRGSAILMSSHLLSDVQEICDRVVIIESGVVIFEGPISQLLSGHLGELGALERKFSELVADAQSRAKAAT